MGLLNNKILSLLLSPLLIVLSLTFSTIVAFRHILYNMGVFRSYRVLGKVISIGNITVGGTGKTPTVISLVNELKSLGKKVIVITRGYKRDGKKRFIVHNSDTLLGNVKNSGDEPLIIAQSTHVPTICDHNRTSAATFAIEEFNPDIIILDDAFQHRKLKRDLDIVLIDERRFLGNKFLLPFGILRDTVSRLYSANILVLSKVSSVDSNLNSKIASLKKFGKKIIISKIIANTIKNNEQELKLIDIHENELFLFCGIGDPENFFSSFSSMNVTEKKSFPDHYYYSNQDINIFLSTSAKYIITTQKDFVKLPMEVQNNNRIFYLDLDLEYYDENFNRTSLTETIYKEKPEWQN